MRILVAACMLALIVMPISGAHAVLLLNGNFNDPASGDPATGWTPWAWGGGWANHENNAGVTYDGSYYLVAGAAGNGGGGFFQTVPATENVTYKLEVLSGADAWWLPTGRMIMFFLDAGDGEVGSASTTTVDPADYGEDQTDIPHPWGSYSLTATAPPGTTQVKVEFAANESSWPGSEGTETGSVWFENASLTVIPEPGSMVLLGLGVLLVRTLRRK